MRVHVRSTEALLVAANVAAACVLAVIAVMRVDDAVSSEPGLRSASAEPLTVLVLVGRAGTTDEIVARALATRLGGTAAVLQGGGLPADVRASVERRQPRRIVVVGGPGAVPQATVRSLAALTTGQVVRRSGADRYATAAEVALHEFPGPVARVRIVSGEAAGRQRTTPAPPDEDASPVLLAERTRVPPRSAEALQRLQPRHTDVVADRSAVSDDVLTQLRGLVDGFVARVAVP